MYRNCHILLVVLLLFTLTACSRDKEKNVFYETGKVDSPVKDVPKDILATQQAFTNLVKVVTPSVVNISTVSKKKVVQPFFEISPFFGDFFEEAPVRPALPQGIEPRLRFHHQQGRLHHHQRPCCP